MLTNVFNKIDKIFSLVTTAGFLKKYKFREGDIIIDAGAYFGYFTILAAKKVGKTGKVIAFEPDPRNYKILQKNVAAAGLNNVIIVKKALFNKNTKYQYPKNLLSERFSWVLQEFKFGR